MSEHVSYFSDVLGALYCKIDGQEWPCLTARQAGPARCGCTHSQWRHLGGSGYCRSRGCECGGYVAVTA